MRRFFVLPALLGFLLYYSTGCSRDNNGGELRGKLVLAAGCGNYVIQLLHGHLPPDKINSTWKDPLTDSVYTNVFTVANNCGFGYHDIAIGDVISFRIDNSGNPYPHDCLYCLWYRPAPPANNVVADVRKLN